MRTQRKLYLVSINRGNMVSFLAKNQTELVTDILVKFPNTRTMKIKECRGW